MQLKDYQNMQLKDNQRYFTKEHRQTVMTFDFANLSHR